MRLRHALALLALPALLSLSGCGGDGKHAAITDYITRVNDVQHGMAGDLREVSVANRQFAKSQTSTKTARDLARSEQTMRQLRRRISRLVPPPEAKHLHALLVQLVDKEVALAHEVHQLALFVGRYGAALAPLQPASAKLKQQLALTAKGEAATKELNAEKADDLTAYAASVAAVRASLSKLEPADVWRPTYTQELASLAQLRSASLALAQAIRANDATAIPHLLEQFDAAAVSNQSIAAQKREISAVAAYNARIRTIVRLVQRVERERVALQKRYG